MTETKESNTIECTEQEFKTMVEQFAELLASLDCKPTLEFLSKEKKKNPKMTYDKILTNLDKQGKDIPNTLYPIFSDAYSDRLLRRIVDEKLKKDITEEIADNSAIGKAFEILIEERKNDPNNDGMLFPKDLRDKLEPFKTMPINDCFKSEDFFSALLSHSGMNEKEQEALWRKIKKEKK